MLFNILKQNAIVCKGLGQLQGYKHVHPVLSLNCNRMCVRLSCAGPKSTQSFQASSSFGRLSIVSTLSRPVDYKLTSLDPQKYPSQDQAFVTVDRDNIINCYLDNNVLSVSDATANEECEFGRRVECHVQVPIKFDIVAKLCGDSSVSISNFENENLDVELQDGKCYLRNIQTGTFRIHSESGEIVSEKLLQGNGKIQSHKGRVDIHKLQAQNVTLQTHGGDIKITNLYANASDIRTESGTVHIVNSHWDTKIKVNERGNVKVDSIDGCLRAEVKKGNIDVTVSQHDQVLVYTREGNVDISVPQTLSSYLEVKGDEVKIDNKLDVKTAKKKDGQVYIETILKGTETPKGTLGSIQPQKLRSGMGTIQAHTARGIISLKSITSNWISTIQASLKQK